MHEIRRAPLRLLPAAVEATPLPGGGMLLRSPVELGPYPKRLGDHLRRWAAEAPERTYIAERDGAGGWRRVTYGEALRRVEGLAQGLLDRGCTAERSVMVLSENSIDYAMLALACLYVGIPVAPISTAYSLVSQDHAKLRYVFDIVRPGLVYAASGKRFAKALAALNLDGVDVLVDTDPPEGMNAILYSSLASAVPGPAVEAAFSRVGPDTVAKILFTSGSTSLPKGVVNTHRMLCSNQQSIAQVWPFLEDRPPVLLDWLPWNHTFGGNKMFNIVLRNGGTLYIDDGKPVPGQIEKTVANLRDVSPTVSLNVPRGYDALLPFLERDASLRESFFRNLDMVFYAAASLPQNIWLRLEQMAVEVRGEPVFMGSGWGATETSPCITMVHYPIERAGIIGLPMPGVELKMIPNDGKMEMRVKGPGVFPGYFRQEELSRKSFDEDGFYLIGDAGKLADPAEPAKGIVFDGRVTEDFKLTTGTWVQVGSLRVGALEAAAPLLQDAVVTGHDRDYIGLLAWLNVEECRRLAGTDSADPEVLVSAPRVVDEVRRLLQSRNASQTGSATRIQRVVLMAEPPNLDANEITDKGYINQRATLERRAALVTKLYEEPAAEGVIVL